MILDTNKSAVEAFNTTGKTGQFSIAQSSVAYQILSKNLYSDPISAIIRELSSNAVDAHKQAGTENEPFVVHLPTSEEPVFSIRDYGTGLSNEDMENLYTTFFDSTKRDSNEYTGCLGLGSKTPFTYTDTFTVKSFFNGIVSVYTMSMAEESPSFVLVVSMPTDEPNGLEISFATNQKDHVFSSPYNGVSEEFYDKASKIYLPYKVKPEINVNLNLFDLYDTNNHLLGLSFDEHGFIVGWEADNGRRPTMTCYKKTQLNDFQ